MIAGANINRKRLNAKKYGQLLARALPRVIRTERENELMLAKVWDLMKKGEEKLTAEELELLEVMSTLIERFEEEHHPIPDSPPDQVLKTLMEDRGLKQKDLLPIFGSSGTVSEVVNGKRSISKAQAKKLSEFFHVSAEVFI
ncbi:MAG TPA: helix-turn-helix domain-containing protein [Blastocatellia bacterium]|nr:helix-turn-helix domain-containing protein [Blastocatellia bacterium]